MIDIQYKKNIHKTETKKTTTCNRKIKDCKNKRVIENCTEIDRQRKKRDYR